MESGMMVKKVMALRVVLLGEGLLELELAEMSLALQLLVFAEGLLGNGAS
jgi:hypothetical protein